MNKNAKFKYTDRNRENIFANVLFTKGIYSKVSLKIQ